MHTLLQEKTNFILCSNNTNFMLYFIMLDTQNDFKRGKTLKKGNVLTNVKCKNNVRGPIFSLFQLLFKHIISFMIFLKF